MLSLYTWISNNLYFRRFFTSSLVTPPPYSDLTDLSGTEYFLDDILLFASKVFSDIQNIHQACFAKVTFIILLCLTEDTASIASLHDPSLLCSVPPALEKVFLSLPSSFYPFLFIATPLFFLPSPFSLPLCPLLSFLFFLSSCLSCACSFRFCPFSLSFLSLVLPPLPSHSISFFPPSMYLFESNPPSHSFSFEYLEASTPLALFIAIEFKLLILRYL